MFCSQCHFDNPPGMRFCGQCGARLGTGTAAPAGDAVRTGKAPDAERRHVTLMFIDVVGYTRLAEQLDPEVLRDVMLQYQTCSAEAIQRYEGHIAKYLGDGELVYFGYPTAHEDDPLRAVLAALDIIKDVRQLAPRLESRYNIEFAIRIGIDSGVVIAGQMGVAANRERLAVVGGPANIAARLQALAEPNTVVISTNTHRLTRDHLSATSLGHHILKGASETVEVFRVEPSQQLRSRSKLIVEHQRTPLVDRNDELRLLLKHWASAKHLKGSAALIVGDAGIGKSRLTSALVGHLAGQDCEWLLGYASPYRRNSALSPIVELLRSQLGFADDDAPAGRLKRIEAAIDRLGLPREQNVPILASLLSVPLSASYPPLELTPPAYRRELLAVLIAWFLRIAAQKPLLLIMEDLHWSDPSTLELLEQLVGRSASAPMFVVLTTRTEFQGALRKHAAVTVVPLGPLTADDSKALIATVSQARALPDAVAARIADKTDGIPLYIEEVTKTVMASDRLAIPESIQDSLMARLDRLADGKEVAQIGAVIGRDFSVDLLAALSSRTKDDLERGLQGLVASGLLYATRNNERVTYTFKHALIQDAAYESMLKATRRELHQKVAAALEGERYAELRTMQPEAVAHHYTEAGMPQPAIRYWHAAGMRSLSRSAVQEAISHLRKALEVAALLDAGRARETLELDLLISLGGPMTAAFGYSAVEVEKIYLRARELAEALGDEVKLFQCLSGLHRCYVTRADYDRAQNAAEAMMEFAERQGDESGYLLEAERAISVVLFGRARSHEALEHCEHGIQIYDPAKHHKHTLMFASDPGLTCMLWSLVPLWLVGFPERAIARSDSSLDLATRLRHGLTLCFATSFAAWMRVYCRDWANARVYAESSIRTCTDRGFLLWLAVSNVFHGRALTRCGEPAAGIASLQNGIAGYRRTGAQISLPQLLSQLAEAYLELGELDKGLATLQDAIDTAVRNNERWWEAELMRLRGDFVRAAGGDTDEVLGWYEKALDVAQRQQAKSLELRALQSLVEVRNSPADRTQLRSVCDWFGDRNPFHDQPAPRQLVQPA